MLEVDPKEKQLINITEWNAREVRIEIFGSGYYVLKDDVAEWIKCNVNKIVSEVTINMNTTTEEK